MCGIAGILNADRGRHVSPGVLDRMVDALTHRGPDDRGCRVDGAVGLGMRRLSIIDVEGGHQPMSTSDGEIHVVYNGECYNHQDLRQQLQDQGHRFRTRCDTEVVLLGFRQWGIRGLCERLNGIYAFCIWDSRNRKAYLCRDRLGVKPLYYVDRHRRFAFSSEVRSLALSGLVRAKIDETALLGYLTYQFTPTDQTLVAGMSKLPPGHFLAWDSGKVTIERYWDFPNCGEDHSADRRERSEALRELLWDTIKRQMMSDVPIGCFLSGGLDSTIIACMMAKLSNHPLRTFSIAFPGSPDCDESEYFERQARELNSQHQTIDFSDQEILARLEEFTWAMDEPVADPAMLPTYLLSQAAAREVKVVLTGEGADEVFAGYPYYRPFVLPGPPLTQYQKADRVLGWASFTKALSDRVGRYIPGPRNDVLSRISNFPYALDPRFIWNLLHEDRRPEVDCVEQFADRLERSAIADLTEASPLQAALAVDTKVWLANDLMPKLDKMTMAHSLEGRVPFLDHRIVEFAHALPGRFKVGPEHGKMILRDAVRGIIPDRMLNRVKHGFNVPLYQWFRGPLREFVRETVLGTTLADTGLFDRPSLEALVVAHLDLDVNFARPLWQLICLSCWYQRLKRELSFCEDREDRPLLHLPDVAQAPTLSTVGEDAGPAAGTRVPDDTVLGRCDIVVPVFEGVHYVRDLLRSLRASTRYPYRVILIDDSANESTYRELEHLVEGEDRLELHRNQANMGFVVTSNRGLAMSRAQYICLMNTDTMVTPGWLTKMVRCAESDPRIAIVNPLSNSCVNLSVPMAPGLNLNTMAIQVGRRSKRRYPDITTAVGFCMLIKRQHLDWLGAFDEVYGHGYCEESDMCMRYTEAGLRVVAADDAFVYHKGCGSFGTWVDRYKVNRRIFDARWEYAYQRDYRNYLRRNPLQYMRDSLLRFTIAKPDWSRLARSLVERRMPGVTEAGHDVPVSPELTGRDGCSDHERPAGGRSPVDAARRALSRPRTKLDPTRREVRYPTRASIGRLPKTDGLRITFLIAKYMPVCGGIISVVQLARELLLAGHDVKLVTECEELNPERFNLPCQPLVYPNRDELLRLFPPSDVVLATFWTTAYDYLPELRRRYDFVSVYFVQDYEVFFYPESDLEHRGRAAQTYAMSEHRIVKSSWLKNLIESKHGVPCEKVHIGLDLAVFRNRKVGDRLGRPPRVLSVARPGETRRGFEEVVKVFHNIHQNRPEVEFAFFGTPDDLMPKDLPFPLVNAGRIEDQGKVAELIASCDVLVDSSLFQGFGRPGLEAMACGTACVLTSEGGVNEYARDDENCLLVRPRDNEAMAKEVMRLLDDDPLRARLRRAGLATAERYCHRDEARLHLQHYRRWLRQKYGEKQELMGSCARDGEPHRPRRGSEVPR